MKIIELMAILEKGKDDSVAKAKQALLPIADQLEQQLNDLRNGVYQVPEQIHDLMLQATGTAGYLETLLHEVETVMRNKELAFYVNQKTATESTGGKFVATSAEKEASAAVNNERFLRNFIEGRMNAAKLVVQSCQSSLKYLAEALKNAGNQVG